MFKAYIYNHYITQKKQCQYYEHIKKIKTCVLQNIFELDL